MQKPRVVVVDDAPAILKAVESVLAGAGYAVRTAPDGPQGLEVMRADPPDLLLLDFQMPGMGGEQVCRAMQAEPALRDIPVVLMTTKGDGAAERVVQQMGVADYITKPFSPDAILALASYTLEKHRTPAATSVDQSLPRARRVAEEHDEQTLVQPLAAFFTTAGETTARAEPSTLPAEPEEGTRRLLIRHLMQRLRELGPGVHDAVTQAVDEALSQLPPVSSALQVDPGRPALWGDFSLVPIPEVFQLMTLQGQTGLFQVWPDARVALGGVVGGNTRFDVYFSQGKIDFVQATNLHEEFLLGRFLVATGAIDRAELDGLLRARKGHKKLLGQQLVALGHVTREQLNAALRDQCSELVYELLRFQRGTFCLRKEVPVPGDVGDARLAIPVDELLLEGLRRVDEWAVIEKHVASFDARFETERRSTERLTDEERYVLTQVGPDLTVRQLIARCGMRPFDVCKILYRLLLARQIRALP
ncbi:MAG: response regulator [Deltaproteobacteria bacterium]|nr:response regulator [Deltaproteobacteria bacterium]